MRRTLMCMMAASAFAFGSLSVACGDDDVQSSPKPDSGTPDTGPPGDGGGGDTGADGGCTFASYVVNLVNTQTTPAAQPDTTLGAQCKESTDQAEFKSLFP